MKANFQQAWTKEKNAQINSDRNEKRDLARNASNIKKIIRYYKQVYTKKT